MAWSSGIFLSLLAIAASSNGMSRVRRLAGGITAETGQFPYFVAIKYNNYLACGGAIISPTKILTAASCITCFRLDKVKEDCLKTITVIAGSSDIRDGKVYRVIDAKIPYIYIYGKTGNDIGVITLESKIEFSANVRSIDLPNEDIVENITAITGGWGRDSEDGALSNIMKTIEEYTISKEKCSQMIPSKTLLTFDEFCATPVEGAQNAGLCSGDGGVPLVRDGKVIGISASRFDCLDGYPDKFTNVYKHLNFIKGEL